MKSVVFVYKIVLLISFADNVTLSMFGMPGSEEGCALNEATERLQVAFVCDQTYTNIKNLKVIAKQVQAIMDSLNSIHKDTEFALTTHANYDNKAFKKIRFKRHKDPEGCYNVAQVMTTNTKLVSDAALRVQRKGSFPGSDRGFYEENSITAVAMTSADLKIGWVEEEIDSIGRNVHRFIVLFTDVFSIFELMVPGNRKPFRGDGTDTCSGNLPATRDQAARVLKRHDLEIIGAFVNMKEGAFNNYNQYFDQYNIPFKGRRFSNDADLDNNLVEFITKAVKEHLVCAFADPPPYNTLGL